MLKNIIISALLFTSTIYAEVQNSIIPAMENTRIVYAYINTQQRDKIDRALNADCPLRIMSFNMLFNLDFSEKQLDEENRWPNRAPRLIEYLDYANADIIGSQELQQDQIDCILSGLNNKYSYFGFSQKGEIEAIFYRPERLSFIEGKVIPFDGYKRNTFCCCHFIDKLTGKDLIVINCHLTFKNIERREFEAKVLSNFIKLQNHHTAVLVTGDFNTFPFRPELKLPFYDGDAILSTIEESPVKNSMQQSLLGHYGPISSTNYSSEFHSSFSSLGTPGVILDHIFVNRNVTVLRHAIDPAKIDDHFPSDHFPVIVDFIVQ